MKNRFKNILKIIEEKTIQIKWPLINNNEKQNDNLLSLQQFKNFDSDNLIPSSLIINNNQDYLIENFDLIKQRYLSLADFNLFRGKFFFVFILIFIKKFKMVNNYELHLNHIIYLFYSK